MISTFNTLNNAEIPVKYQPTVLKVVRENISVALDLNLASCIARLAILTQLPLDEVLMFVRKNTHLGSSEKIYFKAHQLWQDNGCLNEVVLVQK